ncbi:hypothetical protein Q5P01_022180 [Channa striata]|uniref:Uncharacterized protein n=1 Tax=Channa striata TaxID=64152 RepID=A0AA88IS25_CHASR|nr:hypothetical protein Q5P01_022180 [Channa striata]
MARSDGGDAKILLCFALFAVVRSVCLCASLSRPKALDKFRQSSTLSQGQTKGDDLRHGKLLIGRNSLPGAEHSENPLDVDSDYQADMVWREPLNPSVRADDLNLHPHNAAVDRLLQMEPRVECTADAMQLKVHDAAFTPGSLLFVDRGRRRSPVPLSKLPTSCGYTIRSTGRDLILVAPYDGCFVTFEEDSFVLPLRWCGLTVRMSCPLIRRSSPDPPMVTCHAEGMVVKTEWTVSVTKIKVKLNGNWEPLMKASTICGFGVIVHPEGVVISVHYAPCLQKKDGIYTLELAGDGETTISCPSLSPAQLEPTKRPAPTQVPYQPQKAQQPTVPQASSLPQKPEVLETPTQRPEVVGQPPFPYYDFYPYFFYPYFENPDTERTITVKPIPTTTVVIKTTVDQTRQAHNPLPFYIQPPQPALAQPPVSQPPVNQPASQPARQPEGREQIHPYPFFFYPQPPALKPPRIEQPHQNVQTKPQFPKKTPGQTYDPFYPAPFYDGHLSYGHYQMPIPLKQQPLTPAPHLDTPQGPSPIYVQQPQQVPTPTGNAKTTGSAIVQPTYVVLPPDLQPMSPVYCPQVCPSGLSNCCPQITFHQYLNIAPAGFSSKDLLPVYSALPFPRSLAHERGFGSGLGSAPLGQGPSATASNSASVLLQPRAPGSKRLPHLQPPDGNPASLPRSEPTDPYIPNLQYSNWPYLSNNEEQLRRQSPAHHNVLFEHQASGNDLVYQVGQFGHNGELFPTDEKNPTNPKFMSFDKNPHLQQNEELQPTNTQSGKLDNSLFTYMPQEPLTSEYSKPMVSDSPQPLEDGSKKYTEDEKTAHSYSQPKSYVLLPHGPPGGDHYSWNKSLMPFRDSVMAANPTGHHSSELQQLDWLGKGLSNLLPRAVNYMPRSAEEPERLPSFVPASKRPQYVHLPQNGYFSEPHLKPLFPESFEDLKSMMPLGSSQQIPPQIAEETFQL